MLFVDVNNILKKNIEIRCLHNHPLCNNFLYKAFRAANVIKVCRFTDFPISMIDVTFR